MKTPQHPCAMVAAIIEGNAPRPGEEDFWAIIIMPQASEEVLFFQAGTLVGAAEGAAWYMKTTWRAATPAPPVRFLCFQGEKARRAMHWALEAKGQ
jgi:hypothetical protein